MVPPPETYIYISRYGVHMYISFPSISRITNTCQAGRYYIKQGLPLSQVGLINLRLQVEGLFFSFLLRFPGKRNGLSGPFSPGA